MLRGIDKRHEVDPGMLLRDTRTLGQKVRDFFIEPSNVAFLMLAVIIILFTYPAYADLLLVMCTGFFFYTYTRKLSLPFRMPMSSRASAVCWSSVLMLGMSESCPREIAMPRVLQQQRQNLLATDRPSERRASSEQIASEQQLRTRPTPSPWR